MIYDNYGRPTINLRVSVTQKCNLRCEYCHREGEVTSKREMTVDEIVRIVRIALELGINHVKITGGEPLIRPDILEIVEGINGLEGVKDLSMTTNGTLLADKAEGLRKAGLVRVNISLPTLNPEKFKSLSGGNLEDVIEGIEAAVEAGLNPVKLNMVILQSFNEDEVESLIKFAAKTHAILQVIELEPINMDWKYYSTHHYALNGLEDMLSKRAEKVETRPYMQNRRVYVLPETRVEVIRPIENTEFCAHCTRLRVTSDGRLKPCLMRNDNLVDILTPLRAGAEDEVLKGIFIKAIKRREPYYKTRRK